MNAPSIPSMMIPGQAPATSHPQQQLPGKVRPMNEIEQLLQYPDGTRNVLSRWKSGTEHQFIAESLSQCKRLKGRVLLLFSCSLLYSSGEMPETKGNAQIARNLCVTIGNIARNSSSSRNSSSNHVPYKQPGMVGAMNIPVQPAHSEQGDVDNLAVMEALRKLLSCMHAHPFQLEVYAACNYAFSDLLKIDNDIMDSSLRGLLTTWIAHSLMWNITNLGGKNHPPKSPLLASPLFANDLRRASVTLRPSCAPTQGECTISARAATSFFCFYPLARAQESEIDKVYS